MNVTKMLYALGIMVLFVASCQPAPKLTTDELIGQWYLCPIGDVQFNEDGTYYFAGGLDSGHYELEGTTLTFISSDSLICRDQDSIGIYQVERTEDGIHLLLEDDSCDVRSWGLEISLTRTPPELSCESERPKRPTAEPISLPFIEVPTLTPESPTETP